MISTETARAWARTLRSQAEKLSDMADMLLAFAAGADAPSAPLEAEVYLGTSVGPDAGPGAVPGATIATVAPLPGYPLGLPARPGPS